jgi:hypothetical protein
MISIPARGHREPGKISYANPADRLPKSGKKKGVHPIQIPATVHTQRQSL